MTIQQMLPHEFSVFTHTFLLLISPGSMVKLSTRPSNYQSFQTSGLFLAPVIYTKGKVMDV